MSDLLKEAIADAKAVRETALANAKIPLEEAFTTQLKSMLSAKLKNLMSPIFFNLLLYILVQRLYFYEK